MAVPKHQPDSNQDYDADPLEGYSANYLDCRGLSHSWLHIGFFKDHAYIARLAHCTRCGCRKIQTMRITGELMDTRYQHPEGYLFKDQGPVSRADVRRETIRRVGGNAVFESAESLMKARFREIEEGGVTPLRAVGRD